MDQARITRILKQHLSTDRLLGVDAVAINQSKLAELASQPAARPAPTSQPPAQPASRPQYSPTALAGATQLPRKSPDTASACQISTPTIPRKRGKRMTVAEKTEFLQQLNEHEVRLCTACDLCKSRTQTVFGEGHPNADLLFIGEGPGQNEDEQGRPFCGRSGELLDKQILAMGLKRDKVFIANVVKCRPPNNRTPLTPEVDACRHFLLRQIEIIQPKVIITLGGPAAKLILDTKRGITTIRGTWHEFRVNDEADPIPVMPTFHPAYLLRAYTVENRKKVWSDLQKAMELLK